MSLSDAQILQLGEWLHAMEEGTLDEAGRTQLEALLLQNESARRFAVQRLGMGAALCQFAGETQGAAPVEADEKIVSFPTTGASRRRAWPLSAKLALAASLVLGALVAGFGWLASRNPMQVAETHQEGCAVLVDAAAAEWGTRADALQPGMTVGMGPLHLKKGLARLEFYSGASLTLEGDAELDILSVNSAKLSRGKVRAHVPQHARGFKLVTPDAQVVDLGTEFGLAVSDAGKSEVHVFDGEVLASLDQGKSETSLKRGAVWDAAHGADSARQADSSAFADLNALREHSRTADEQRLQRWHEGMSGWFKDPRLLTAYTFEPTSEWDRTLRNQKIGAAESTHGSIVGARWTQGRWQGKRALEFKSPGDRVRLSVPGEYQAITLTAWVQVGGVDRRFNSLFLTDTWKPGNPHWQILQNGAFVLGVHEYKGNKMQHVFESPQFLGPDKLGVWYHLATTFDLRTHVGRHYINGVMVTDYREEDINPDTRIVIGDGELSNWGLPHGSKPRAEVRSFNGRMDEFLMFSEALGPEEIARLYQMGRPD
jgi:hypothetical protein